MSPARTDAVPLPVPPPAEAAFAIRVKDVSKVYRVYDSPQDRLKQMLWRGRRRYGREIWALRGVSIDVAKGDTVAIVGRNGSGKSTLLQIVAGTLAATSGEVEVRGRVAALLELGSGFNPEFTGRENVMLNGAILGISPEEMRDRFGEIAAFADIGDFIDQPVKIYSSGMLVRLAFAVQAHLDPEVLIVDEALSVGDLYYQTKCMARISRLRKEGVSILLVSHSLATVKALASFCVLLESGRVVMQGHPDPVTDRYVSMLLSPPASGETRPVPAVAPATSVPAVHLHPPFESRIGERFGSGQAHYVECRILQDGREVAIAMHGRTCEIEAYLRFDSAVEDAGEVGIVVRTVDGLDLFAVNSFLLHQRFPAQAAVTVARLVFRFPVVMAPGNYSVALGYRVPVQGEYVDKVVNALVFAVQAADGMPIPFMLAVDGEFRFDVVEAPGASR